MALQDGIYLVRFSTPLGEGSGVTYLTEGKLYGGDSMMAYVGKFSEKGGSANAEVRVFQHSNTPGMESVLGTNSATLKLSGDVSGSTANLSGSAPQAPGVQLSVSLSPLSE
ncbi:MAG TPA: GrlR family regulatory protein [Sphingomicrobium sp.]|nr:GrlR family regulatory protein [Sphingomicrobium sp.]